jgi:hypothetical protein
MSAVVYYLAAQQSVQSADPMPSYTLMGPGFEGPASANDSRAGAPLRDPEAPTGAALLRSLPAARFFDDVDAGPVARAPRLA